MSSNMNIRLRTSSASSGSRPSSPSRMSRSVARSARLMMSTSGCRCRRPATVRGLQHRATACARGSPRPARRSRARCGPSSRCGGRRRPAAPAQAAEHRRRLVGAACARAPARWSAGARPGGTRATWRGSARLQELERHLARPRPRAAEDVGRPCPRPGRLRASRGRSPCRPGRRTGARSPSRGTRHDLVGDLGARRRSSRTISAMTPRPRSRASRRGCAAESSRSICTSRIGGLLGPAERPHRSRVHQPRRSASQPRSSWATSSGWA